MTGADLTGAGPDAATRRILYGTDEPVPATIALRAGPLSVSYCAGALREIRLGEIEIWHGVTFTVRDADWGTPPLVVTEETVERSETGFRVRVEGYVESVPPVDVRLAIEGGPDARIRFSGEAVPRGDLQTNRLGLCVLHPMAAGGRPVAIEHTDGRRSDSTFPVLVPPWPPFMLVRAIRHAYADGAWAACELSGDLFECEDQRNNADPSFKTYSRSNLMPRPYRVAAGRAIRHAAELRLDGLPPVTPPARPRGASEPVRVRPEPDALLGPPVGIAVSARDAAAPQALAGRLARLRPKHLHLTLWPDTGRIDWAGLRALTEAGTSALRLDLVSPRPEDQAAGLPALADALARAGLVPESLGVFPGGPEAVALARALWPDTRIGGGTPHYFAQANRLEDLGAVDFLSFTTSPLVHGADDAAVMLSLRSLPSLVATLRARYPSLPVRVGPSAIAVRRSPLGAQPDTDGTRRLALAGRDPRSRARFGAAWAAGYLASAAGAGIEALTLGSLTGDAGVIGAEGEAFPAFAVLERLASAPGIREAASSDPGRVAAVTLGRTDLLLANLTAGTIPVALDDVPGYAATLSDVATGTRPGAGTGSAERPAGHLVLAPYAVASLTAS